MCCARVRTQNVLDRTRRISPQKVIQTQANPQKAVSATLLAVVILAQIDCFGKCSLAFVGELYTPAAHLKCFHDINHLLMKRYVSAALIAMSKSMESDVPSTLTVTT